MTVKIVPAKLEHIPHIAANVREADRQEIWDYALMKPQEALEKSFHASTVVSTGMVDGVPVCMFGVAPASLLSIVGRPWMIGTSDLNKYARQFRKRDKMVVRAMLTHFSYLENYVEEANVRSVKWLKEIGFQMGEPEPIGPFNRPFIKFWMEAR